jgi:hypothetical protein
MTRARAAIAIDLTAFINVIFLRLPSENRTGIFKIKFHHGSGYLKLSNLQPGRTSKRG